MQGNVVKWFSLLLAFCMAPSSYAQNKLTENFILASTSIEGLKNTVQEVKGQTSLPIVFPDIVPKNRPQVKYYASAFFYANKTAYVINIGATKDCKGTRYCTLGYIEVQKGDKAQMYSGINGEKLTRPVMLTKDIMGYFTEGYAQVIYFEPNIQWVKNGVVYKLSWNNADKEALIMMANSVITSVNK